ncbi:hypothetical protein [Paenibacillus prosopidis]|uniref:Uncharacterized protein n=1 Tax=Paenibacillus prosopidis TaxID=630520 RepID=A0A368W0R7_9BACL|nr:hypothetical protein [Paenibacillus prosopidis]RCW48050.1 hypothetical protein DFP97_107252 [Paenibacillus prosopidis]
MSQGIFLPLNFNSIWYLGLGTLSLILLSFVFFKSKNYRSLLLFLGMIGVGYTIEFVIYVLLESYAYNPQIIARDAYYDNNMGAIASNMLTLPVTAALIAVFRLNWIWIAVITGLVLGVEWLFEKLGIYRHYWWRLGYTAIGLPVYYGLARAWFTRLMLPLKGFLHALTLFFITWALFTMQFFAIAFFNSRYYQLGWFDSRSHDTTAMTSIFGILFSIFFVWVLKHNWKYKWLKYMLPPVVISGVYMIFDIIGVLHSLVWWDYWYCFGVNLFVLIAVDAISRRLRNGPG